MNAIALFSISILAGLGTLLALLSQLGAAVALWAVMALATPPSQAGRALAPEPVQ